MLDAHWLERRVRVAAADPRLDVVWGHYEPLAAGFFVTSSALAYVAPLTETAAGAARDHSVASCLLRRYLWRRAGGFADLRAAEDLLFMRRVSELGSAEATAPEAGVCWQLAPSPWSTFRRFRTYSRVNAAMGEQEFWHRRLGRM